MRVLIADRQEATRAALRMLLQEEVGLTVVGQAADSQDLLAQMVHARPDVVVLDWELPGLPISSLISDMQNQGDGPSVVVLSCRPEAARSALEAGADAFFSKADPPRRLLSVIHGLDAAPVRK